MSKPKPAPRNRAMKKIPTANSFTGKKRTANLKTARRTIRHDKKGKRHTNPIGSGPSIETFTADQLQHMDFPSVRYAVDGYIAEGLTLLAGKPKVGKSWMALDFAMAIASGDVALGSIPCEQGTVLYCALEDNQRRLQRRIRQRYGNKNSWPKSFHFTTQLPRLNEGGLERLENWILANNPALVIIDTFVCVRPDSRREGGYNADYAALSPLQKLAGELGVCIVVIHHLRKMIGDDPLDMISGTTGLTGAIDTALVLHRGSNGLTLYGRGREIEEIEVAVEFDGGAWKFLGAASEVRRSDERSAIIKVLTGVSKPFGPKKIAEILGGSENNIKQLLHKMAKAGEVEKQARGQYCVPKN